jgi:hypothetical protein
LSSKRRITTAELLTDVRRVARKLNHYPTVKEYAQFGRYSEITLCRRMACSWGEIIKRAGLRYERRHTIPKHTERQLDDDIKRVARELGRLPRRSEYESMGSYSLGTYFRRVCGKMSGRWEDVLKRYFDYRESARPTKEQMREDVSRQKGERREELIRDLHLVSLIVGRFPTIHEYKKYGKFDFFRLLVLMKPEDGSRRYGLWRDVRTLLDESVSQVKQMGAVEDETRERLKVQSVDAIKEFFRRSQNNAATP